VSVRKKPPPSPALVKPKNIPKERTRNIKEEPKTNANLNSFNDMDGEKEAIVARGTYN